MSAYPETYWDPGTAGAIQAAELILGHIFSFFQPKSVVDIGCGIGTWLSVCKRLGVSRVVGLDGEYVPAEKLQIDRAEFRAADLSDPRPLSERFDMAISLEVGEHLPGERVDAFVDLIVSGSDFICFSAAIPHQGGADHINEQWPPYWVEKFERHGYACVDAIRPVVWDDPRVPYWYAQNTMLFVKERYLTIYPGMRTHVRRASDKFLRLVHPNGYVGMHSKMIAAKQAIAAAQAEAVALEQRIATLRESLERAQGALYF
jgi:SAM-dependent methyltransferase